MDSKLIQKRAIQKTADGTGDLTGSKVSDKISKFSITLPMKVTNYLRKKYLKKNIYLQRRDRKLLKI